MKLKLHIIRFKTIKNIRNRRNNTIFKHTDKAFFNKRKFEKYTYLDFIKNSIFFENILYEIKRKREREKKTTTK